MIEAARNLGAGRIRGLVGIVLPLVRAPLLVACILTFVTLMSVLSVPVRRFVGNKGQVGKSRAQHCEARWLAEFGNLLLISS
jgi:ABC-type spermidine/putrescine transport system permease subunit I